MTPNIIKGNTDNNQFKIGIVVARWHPTITEALLEGALTTFKKKDFNSDQIIVTYCPGTYEIPFTTRQLLPKVDGVVTLGAVIRGETTHYDYVCEAVNQGITTINMNGDKPVSFGVLTTENEQQARVRCGLEGSKGNKGKEASLALIEMLTLTGQIKQL